MTMRIKSLEAEVDSLKQKEKQLKLEIKKRGDIARQMCNAKDEEIRTLREKVHFEQRQAKSSPRSSWVSNTKNNSSNSLGQMQSPQLQDSGKLGGTNVLVSGLVPMHLRPTEIETHTGPGGYETPVKENSSGISNGAYGQYNESHGGVNADLEYEGGRDAEEGELTEEVRM